MKVERHFDLNTIMCIIIYTHEQPTFRGEECRRINVNTFPVFIDYHKFLNTKKKYIYVILGKNYVLEIRSYMETSKMIILFRLRCVILSKS